MPELSWNTTNILILVAALSTGAYVFFDSWKKMKNNIHKSIFWGVMSFLFFPLAPIIYFILRYLSKKADDLGL